MTYGGLPGWAIDLIRDGVPARDLQSAARWAVVWRAVYRTALSAQNHSWGYPEWHLVITEPDSRLGEQFRRRDARRRKTEAQLARDLLKIWERAWEYRTANPAWSAVEVAEIAEARARLLAAVATEADNDLTDAERAVLGHLAAEVDARRMLAVALPWRQIMVRTGLTEARAKRALTTLQERGLLVLHKRGTSASSPSARRANIYKTPDESSPLWASYLCRETRPMGGAAEDYGMARTALLGAVADIYGTHARPPAAVDPLADDGLASQIAVLEAQIAALKRLQAGAGLRPRPPVSALEDP